MVKKLLKELVKKLVKNCQKIGEKIHQKIHQKKFITARKLTQNSIFWKIITEKVGPQSRFLEAPLVRQKDGELENENS